MSLVFQDFGVKKFTRPTPIIVGEPSPIVTEPVIFSAEKITTIPTITKETLPEHIIKASPTSLIDGEKKLIEEPKADYGGTLTGAGAGFLVANIPGALIGAGLGYLLLTKKTK